MFGSKVRSKKSSFLGRLFRSFLSIVILAALVLGLSYLVKEIAVTDPQKIAHLLKPVFSYLHLSVDEGDVGAVAGEFVERISQTNLGSGVSTSRETVVSDNSEVLASNSKVLFKVAVISDIHQDIQNMTKALESVKNTEIEAIFLLGDATNYGDLESLQKVKDVLENSSIKYFTLPGDHDIAQTSDLSNYSQVFKTDHQLVNIKGVNILMLDNAFNYTKIDQGQVIWLENNIGQADFVMLSQPLYTKGLSSFFEKIYMGSSNITPDSADLIAKQEEVRSQGAMILDLIRQEGGIKAVFAGEHHKSSELTDEKRPVLKHYVVGAVSSTVNEYPQSVIQTPRFTILSIYEDGGYKVEDVAL